MSASPITGNAPSAETLRLSSYLAVDVAYIRPALLRFTDPSKVPPGTPNFSTSEMEVAIHKGIKQALDIKQRLSQESVCPTHFEVHDPLFNLRKIVDGYASHRTSALYTAPAEFSQIRKFLNWVSASRRSVKNGPTTVASVPSAPVAPAQTPVVIETDALVDEDATMHPPTAPTVPASSTIPMALDPPVDAASVAPAAEETVALTPAPATSWADDESNELPSIPDYSNKRPRLADVPGFPSTSTATSIMNSVVYSEQVDTVLRNARDVTSTPFDIGSDAILCTTLSDQTTSIQLIVHKIHSLLQIHDLLVGQHRVLTARLDELSQISSLERP